MESSSDHHHHHDHDHQYHDDYIHLHHHETQQLSSTSSVSMFLSPQQQMNLGAAENGGYFHSPLTVMPLKSDGSLCITPMDAFHRSHSQPADAPKLENFLGISLDSIYKEEEQQQLESYISALSYQGFSSQDDLLKNFMRYHNGYVVNDELLMGNHQNIVSSGNNNTVPQNGGDLQSLSLTMSPNSQSSCVSVAPTANNNNNHVSAMETKKRGFGKMVNCKETVHRKSIDTFGQRTSQFRGVTKHRWTGRYEAHLWDNTCKKEGQTRKGRQGGYDMEEKAARAYDLAALKYWGLSAHTNFPMEGYKEEIEEMKNMSRQEYVAHLRRKSSGFSRGASMYRGVTRHHQHGRWQARIGRVAGNKDLYLGTFGTQEEAAEAYDVAAIKFRGTNAVTNFDISRYHVQKIMSSNTLLAGEQAKRNKVDFFEAFKDTPNPNTNDPSFSLGLQDLVGLEMVNPTQHTPHFSTTSSLVTSLNSSREGSPDENSTSNSMANLPVLTAGNGASQE
ncbi:unnamed protein product [Amaranthus hypochondriacus]